MSDPSAITIGNFDGVHCGHRALIETARRCAAEAGWVVALVFDPHPLAQLRPEAAPQPISTFESRARSLQDAGADRIVRLEPRESILSLEPRDFLAGLCRDYQPGFIVEGEDFRFGRDRRGTVQTLREAGPAFGYETIVVPPVEVVLGDHSVVRASSTLARWLIARGRVRDAAAVLGRPYELVSTVEAGSKRGRAIGIPTINLADSGCLLPADGIYAGCAILPDGRTFRAAISVGDNPTFAGTRRVCEAHLIGYDGPLDHYGWTVRLAFHAWIRDQIDYRDVSELIRQIRRDIARSQQLVIDPPAVCQPIPDSAHRRS